MKTKQKNLNSNKIRISKLISFCIKNHKKLKRKSTKKKENLNFRAKNDPWLLHNLNKKHDFFSRKKWSHNFRKAWKKAKKLYFRIEYRSVDFWCFFRNWFLGVLILLQRWCYKKWWIPKRSYRQSWVECHGQHVADFFVAKRLFWHWWYRKKDLFGYFLGSISPKPFGLLRNWLTFCNEKEKNTQCIQENWRRKAWCTFVFVSLSRKILIGLGKIQILSKLYITVSIFCSFTFS